MIPVADSNLAEQLGVPVQIITEHRKKVLKEGLDWSRDGQRILWLAPGLTAIAEHLRALQLTPAEAEKKEGGAAAAGEASSGSGEGEGAPDPAPPPEAPQAAPVAPEPPAAAPPAPAVVPRTATARILSKYPNPIWVRAHIPGEKNGTAFDVRVRNNHNLAAHALIPIQQLPAGPWTCTHPQHTPKPFAA